MTPKDEGTVDQVLSELVKTLAFLFRSPGSTGVQISFQNGNPCQTENFKETRWLLSEDFLVFGKRAGSIKVCLISGDSESPENPFLKEEQFFLKTLTKLLGPCLEYRITKKDLFEREKICQILLMNSPNPVNLIKPDYSLDYINPAMENLTGYSLQEVEGKKPPFPWWPEEKRDNIYKDLTAAMNMGGVYRLEELYQTKDGGYFWVEVTSKPASQGNDFLGLVCNWVDITQRKKAEEALENSRSELSKQKLDLERKNIALGELLEQIGREKSKIKENIRVNFEELMSPILEKLRLNDDIGKCALMLENHLKDITSSYGSKITERRIKLTPREIELCNMIKSRLATKDISKLLNISYLTIEKHRNNIRKKLGISKKKINLASYLSGL